MDDRLSEDEEVVIRANEGQRSPDEKEEVLRLKEELHYALANAEDVKQRSDRLKRIAEEAEREKERANGEARHRLEEKDDEIKQLRAELSKLNAQDIDGMDRPYVRSPPNPGMFVSPGFGDMARPSGGRPGLFNHPSRHTPPNDRGFQRRAFVPSPRPYPRYSVPMPAPSMFDGHSSWEGFIQPFLSMADACNWGEDEKLFRLTNSLRGIAAEYAFTQLGSESTASFQNLLNALEVRFKDQRTLASYLGELEGRKLRDREKLAEYVSDIKRLVLKSFPTADERTRETINLRYFLKGLGDQQMAVAVGMKNPKTIEEARQDLETYRSLQDEISSKGKVRSVGNSNNVESRFVTVDELNMFGDSLMVCVTAKLDKITSVIEDFKTEREAQKKNRQKQKRNMSEVECYNCHEMGHFARDCPRKRRVMYHRWKTRIDRNTRPCFGHK